MPWTKAETTQETISNDRNVLYRGGILNVDPRKSVMCRLRKNKNHEAEEVRWLVCVVYSKDVNVL